MSTFPGDDNRPKIPGSAVRVDQLEAELAAAKQLIADQQQMLNANLAALADRGSSVDAEAPGLSLPPLRTGPLPPDSERLPIPLPQFGPATGDIAERVVRAAAEKGVVDSSTLGINATAAYAFPETAALPSEPVERPHIERPARFTMLLSAMLLLCGVAAALLWSKIGPFANSYSANGVSRLAPLPSQGVSDNHAPTVAATEPSPKHFSSGPVLDPVSTGAPSVSTPRFALRPIVPQQGGHRKIQVVQRLAVAASYATQPVHRYRRVLAADRRHSRRSAKEEGDSALDREAQHHPPPGWDENDDKWLDKF